MRTHLSSLAKGGIATLAAGTLALAGATPAVARDYGSANISIGDLLAGALILGAGRDNRGYDYGDRYDNRYGNNYGRGNPRSAVEQCVAVAQQQAGRYGRAQVTRINQVKDKDRGWEVKGEITVGGSNWNNGGRYDDRYGGRYDNRWGNRSGYADSGNFKCRIDRGRVVDLDFSGLRGL